jgi:hypothetical protein
VNTMIELVDRRSAWRLCRALDVWRAAHPGLVRARFGGSPRYVTEYSVADGIGQGVPRWSCSSGAVPPLTVWYALPLFRTRETVR